MDNNNQEYIDFPNVSTYHARALTNSRRDFLNFISEERSDISTYKKYILIKMKGSEIFDISNNISNVILRRNVPQWVINEIKEGRSVKAIVYVAWQRPIYFKYREEGSVVSMLRRYNHVYRNSDLDNIFILNDKICGIFDITNIIQTKIQKTGKYDNNIIEISKKANKTVEDIENYGKIKPIYSIEVNNLKFSPTNFFAGIFMTKFKVNEVELGKTTKYELIPLELCNSCNNMVTVWI